MTPDQLDALKAYIKAVVAHKIVDAFGREGLHEWMAENDAEETLDNVLLTPKNYD